jgi:hypothetical protein
VTRQDRSNYSNSDKVASNSDCHISFKGVQSEDNPMNRKLMWAIGGGGLLIASAALVIVMGEPIKGPVFIAGDQPVTEDQVRQKLQSDGWSNVQIVRNGRYLEAVASKNGQNSKVVVDSQTGRLRAGDDGDDDQD